MQEGRGEGRVVWGRAVFLLTIAAPPVFAPAPARADAWPACAAASIAPISVEAVTARDGATFRISDGREVRLAGVVAATALDHNPDAVDRGTAALGSLVGGKRVLLYAVSEADRYGRVVAQAALADGGAWIQGSLVSDGILRVGPEAGEPACTDDLLVHERAARAARTGLWQEAGFSVQPADNLAALNAAIGRFVVVEGRVTRVGETAAKTYIDFGRRYTEDFTLIIPRESRAAFRAAGLDPKALRGKRVRARGVLFSSGGPAIEIRKPASIEIVQDGT